MDDKNFSTEMLVKLFIEELMKHYWGPLWRYLDANPELFGTVTGFLVNPEKIIVYIGQTHIGIEYIGSEILDKPTLEGVLEIDYHDYSIRDCNLFEEIIGFGSDANTSSNFAIPLLTINEELIFPTNRGHDRMLELGWNFAAQNSMMGFNMPTPVIPENQFTRIVNGLFFDVDGSGLKTRHIKWLDLIPISFDNSEPEGDLVGFSLHPMQQIVEHDANYVYPIPDDYKYSKLPKINRFIEVWGSINSSETDITSYLAKPENRFILTMRFGVVDMHPELTCEWQSENKPPIRPDFFIVHSNGYADIVEFKLPTISKKIVVGTNNRESFSAWLHSYIAQTRVYASYFDDPNNRRWFEERYGFKVHKPKRWLVVGRRSDFDSEIWREILADYRDIEIITFDDLVDGVVAQFYK